METQKELPMEVEIDNNDNNLPVYPEGVLPPHEKYDFPKYEGDMNDLNERRCVKLFNIWTHYSDLRKNEMLFKILNEAEEKDEKIKFLKLIIVLTIDRLGKILSDTNISEELSKGNQGSP